MSIYYITGLVHYADHQCCVLGHYIKLWLCHPQLYFSGDFSEMAS